VEAGVPGAATVEVGREGGRPRGTDAGASAAEDPTHVALAKEIATARVGMEWREVAAVRFMRRRSRSRIRTRGIETIRMILRTEENGAIGVPWSLTIWDSQICKSVRERETALPLLSHPCV
jgi:hypothetical protein